MKRPFALAIVLVTVLTGGTLLFHSISPEPRRALPEASAETTKKEKGVDSISIPFAKVTDAGIELAKAGPGTLRDSVVLNGILQPNQESLVQVTPRFSGVFRELTKRVGDPIDKNALLGKIESNQSLTVYDLRAPMAGTVIDRQASLGEFASEQRPAFVVADLSTVWADFAIYRRDLGRVLVGSVVLIDPEDGGDALETTIAYVSPVGSAETQSALARAVVNNPNGRLRPGLFVTGRVLLTEKPVPMAVKASALQTYENKAVVFVRKGDQFEARPVDVGQRDGKLVEIKAGLAAGETYAADNSFIVKAELGKGAAAHDD